MMVSIEAVASLAIGVPGLDRDLRADRQTMDRRLSDEMMVLCIDMANVFG